MRKMISEVKKFLPLYHQLKLIELCVKLLNRKSRHGKKIPLYRSVHYVCESSIHDFRPRC